MLTSQRRCGVESMASARTACPSSPRSSARPWTLFERSRTLPTRTFLSSSRSSCACSSASRNMTACTRHGAGPARHESEVRPYLPRRWRQRLAAVSTAVAAMKEHRHYLGTWNLQIVRQPRSSLFLHPLHCSTPDTRNALYWPNWAVAASYMAPPAVHSARIAHQRVLQRKPDTGGCRGVAK